MSKLNKLKEQLKEWSDSYYNKGVSMVPDKIYDDNYNLLRKLETENLGMVSADSPTQTVGSTIIGSTFAKVEHSERMISLQNAMSYEDVDNFVLRTSDNIGDLYTLEYKVDGLSIALRYKAGSLVQALTRGDGDVGEDITANAKEIADIPLSIPFQGDVEFRGEVYMSDKVFAYLNSSGNSFANPRNAAAGTLRQSDPKIVAARRLSSKIYWTSAIQGTQKRNLEFIEHNGFNTQDSMTVESSDVESTLKSMEKQRATIGYAIDGIVIKVDDWGKWAKIGSTSKFPKYMIAYKFPEEVKSTRLLSIFPTVGKTGKITYNAELEAVELAGTTVRKSTLHNAAHVSALGINAGDDVYMKKAGEIIPKVVGLASKHNRNAWSPDEVCPSCGSQLVQPVGLVDQYCVEEQTCPEQLIARIKSFADRDCANIVGLSESMARKIVENGIVHDHQEIWLLGISRLGLLALGKNVEKSVDKLLANIEVAKTGMTLDRIIRSFFIPGVGRSMSKVLAKKYKSLGGLLLAEQSDLASTKGVGPQAAEKISEWIVSRGEEAASFYIGMGMDPHVGKVVTASGVLSGKTFVITGTFECGRKEIATDIESLGGTVKSSISKNVDYLIAGDKAGSKLGKARAIEVEILDWAAWQELKGGE